MPQSPFIDLALEQAQKARLLCPPNPAVGCVLTDAHGQVLGMGHTQAVGGAHAEIMALRDAQARGHSVRGATAYVTLEPCCHQGRTGPCCEALIAAGIARVVASSADPNPKVHGQGFARLRSVGITVDVGPGAAATRALNRGFFQRMETGRPWVRIKVASTMDGQTALCNGTSQWITSEAARADGHSWRALACTVLTGSGTVLADDPQLDVRFTVTPRQPRGALVDGSLRVPTTARLLRQENRAVTVYTTCTDAARIAALQEMHATVVPCAAPAGNHGDRVDLTAMLAHMAASEINEVHVEAGPGLNGALLRRNLADEVLWYVAPMLMGVGRPMATWEPLTHLDAATRLRFEDVRSIGPDLRVVARRISEAVGPSLPVA